MPAPASLNCPQPNAQYEKSSAALLGGSAYSLFLLSGNPKLQALGVQVAFAGLRMALAATQTTSFFKCMDDVSNPLTTLFPQRTGNPPQYVGQLSKALAKIPTLSGFVGGTAAYTPLPLGPDGIRVICMSIAMMSGNPTTEAPGYEWRRNLLWQGAADITNALYSTIDTTNLLTKLQRKELCLFTRTIYTFIQADPAQAGKPVPLTGSQAVIAAPGIPGINPVTEYDASCTTTEASCTGKTGQPDWLTPFFEANHEPNLSQNHDFTPSPATGPGSPFIKVCKAAFTP
jgi:hypothetical protein